MALVDSLGDDSGKIKISPLPKRLNPLLSAISNLGLILFFSAFVFLFINMPAYLMISKYKLSPKSIAIESPEIILNEAKKPGAINKYDDNTIVIPKIGVKAPIQWDVASGKVMDSLQNGTVHLAGTGHPDESNNTFITGHSSNYWWRGGDYNNVFALLPKLEGKDEIFIIYHGKIEKYQVKKSVDVKKNEVGPYVVTTKEQLTLMTCVPVGTNLRRLLIIAERVK